MVPPAALTPVREHLAQTSNRLTLPRAHLIRMNRVLRGDLLQRPVAPERASSAIFAFNSPENLRRLLISYPSVSQRNTP